MARVWYTQSYMHTTLFDFTLPELEAEVARLGHPAYRARQLFQWLHARGTTDPARMSNLPADLRRQLAEGRQCPPAEVVRALTSRDGLTTKLLVGFADGERVETVAMDAPGEQGARTRRTVCISTQAGCAMGCVFCATGQMGFARQLSAGEIVAQVDLARGLSERPLTILVVMGLGEPLANYVQTITAVRLHHDPPGLG
ncbi:MAG: 23S rRNA (adenine(2503)-C(2))-methyltransferase RlmN, partial [Chloroflexi bacterium]|nr:23S rRNA (adenine(2503)-C(2))-methyltransferase RlmN [Chloroflexota bacterium]